MSAAELIIKFFDNYYDSEKNPGIVEYKERLLDLTIKNSTFLSGEPTEIAINAINNIGSAFAKIINFDYVPLNERDFNSIINGTF